MNELELLKELMQNGDEDQLNDVISKGALKMNDADIATVSFVFWFVYMAETDLNTVLKKAWSFAINGQSVEQQAAAESALLARIGGERKINIKDPESFTDKIQIYQALFGKTARTTILWKLKNIRNDLSHNRIQNLSYNGAPFVERLTKEKLLNDYFESAFDGDLSKSDIWNSFTDEEKEEIEKQVEDARVRGTI